MSGTSLYDADFYAWTQDQAARLRDLLDRRVNTDLDLANLAEEVESMSKSNRAQLVNRLAQLDSHLLKLAFSLSWEPRRQWTLSVKGQRVAIEGLLRHNPSLRRELPQAVEEAHELALAEFDQEKLAELNMPELPVVCPLAIEEMLDGNWWPVARGAS